MVDGMRYCQDQLCLIIPSLEKLTNVCVMEQTTLIQRSSKQYILYYA